MFEFDLVDDGTMDTVVEVWKNDRLIGTFRYDCEFAAEYRDESGALDMDRFIEEVLMEDAENDFLDDTNLPEDGWA